MKNSTRAWIHSLLAAGVSGAGTGLTGFAVGVTPKQLWLLVLINIVTTVGAFLKQSPLPPEPKQ